jgi:hypothetical protein
LRAAISNVGAQELASLLLVSQQANETQIKRKPQAE